MSITISAVSYSFLEDDHLERAGKAINVPFRLPGMYPLTSGRILDSGNRQQSCMDGLLCEDVVDSPNSFS